MPPLEVKTTVLAGGRIEIEHPDLPVGREVTVRIIMDDPGRPKRSFLDVIGNYEGGRAFKTAEEVDRFIREERDSWGD